MAKENEGALPLCHMADHPWISLEDFEIQMSNTNTSAICESQCQPNCEETTYDYSITTSRLQLQSLCQAKAQTRKASWGYKCFGCGLHYGFQMAIDLWKRTNSILGFLSDERAAGEAPAMFNPGSAYLNTEPSVRMYFIDPHMYNRIW